MTRNWTHLRRGLLAVACAGSLVFGAAQAFAAPAGAKFQTCSSYGTTFDSGCEIACKQAGYDWGFCRYGQCVCRNFTVPS